MKFLILKLVFFTGTVDAQWIDDLFRLSVLKEEYHDISFHLYTRNNSNKEKQLNENNLDQIDKRYHIKIIVHGWLSNNKHDWIKAITNEYLYKDGYNVIQVDWSEITFQSYFIAAASCPAAGRRIGKLIVNLHQNHGIPLSNFHLIGHSLGAHVAGYAGRKVFKLTKSKISRISALDAASPFFESKGLHTYDGLVTFVASTELKNEPVVTNKLLKDLIESHTFKSLEFLINDGLNQTDADIVDAIHTDACEIGYKSRLGTVDFYPNGGTPIQPGCRACPSKIALFDVIRVSKIIDCLTCSHYRSCWYFSNSINNSNFVSTKCSSWNKYKNGNCDNNSKILMGDGYTYSPEATGKFYLRTNPKPPYAQDV